jgi:hypothetical protein
MDDDNKSPAGSSIVRFQSRDPEKPTAKELGNQSKLDRKADAAKAKAAFEEVLKKRRRLKANKTGNLALRNRKASRRALKSLRSSIPRI